MGSSPHPLEAVYQAREALQAAASQLRTGLELSDLPAYRSAVQGTLAAMGELTRTLADQLGRQTTDPSGAAAVTEAAHHLTALHGWQVSVGSADANPPSALSTRTMSRSAASDSGTGLELTG